MQLYQFFYTYQEEQEEPYFQQQLQETQCSQESIPQEEQKKIIQNMVFQYLPHNLEDLLDPQTTTQFLSFNKIQSYFYQFITGLAQMHEQNIIHRDLKPDNLFIDQEYEVLKIGDFGSAKILQKGSFKTPRIYNEWYRPPQCFMGCCNYDCSADIWAAGCILAEMMSKQVLIKGQNEQTQIIEILKVLGAPNQSQRAKLKKIEKNFSFLEFLTEDNEFQKQDIFCFLSLDHYELEQLEVAADLINKMLKYVPKERLTAKKILEHKFFKIS